MLTQEQLQELLSYESENGDVLSLYLAADTTHETIDTIKLQVKGMIRDAGVKEYEDAVAIEQYLDHSFDWTAPGLALFTQGGGEFFRAYPTAVAFRSRLRVGLRPYVKPLAHLLDYYAHYGVVLIDRLGARFYEYHLGELQASDGNLGEEVHKLKQGGGSTTVGMRGGNSGGRHEAEVALRNLRESAEAAASFFQGIPVRRLFIGGTSATVAEFRTLLPKQLQSCIAGTFTMAMSANEDAVRRESLRLLQQANDERELRLVDSLLATAARGGTAVLGLDDTLQAVSERRVQTLIVSDGYREPGFVHLGASFVTAHIARSPYEVGELTAVDDIIDPACTLTLNNSGHVEVIRGNVKLEDAGQIGALLHY